MLSQGAIIPSSDALSRKGKSKAGGTNEEKSQKRRGKKIWRTSCNPYSGFQLLFPWGDQPQFPSDHPVDEEFFTQTIHRIFCLSIVSKGRGLGNGFFLQLFPLTDPR